MSSDEQRIAEIRARHHREVGYDYDEAGRRLEGDPECAEYGEAWPCDVAVLLAEIDALTSRLKQDETTNTAVIRANAEGIADLEDVRDDLEAKVNALTAEHARLRERVAAMEAGLQQIVEQGEANHRDDVCSLDALMTIEDIARNTLAGQEPAGEAS